MGHNDIKQKLETTIKNLSLGVAINSLGVDNITYILKKPIDEIVLDVLKGIHYVDNEYEKFTFEVRNIVDYDKPYIIYLYELLVKINPNGYITIDGKKFQIPEVFNDPEYAGWASYDIEEIITDVLNEKLGINLSDELKISVHSYLPN